MMNAPLLNASLRQTAIGMLLATLMTGCGQYGGLYLPEEPPAEQKAREEVMEQEEEEVTQPEEL